MVLGKSACVLVSDFLGTAIGEGPPALNVITSLTAGELHPGSKEGELYLAEHPTGHLLLQWLMEQNKKVGGHRRQDCFGKTLIEHLGMKGPKSGASVIRGAFILSSLLHSLTRKLQTKSKLD